MSGRLVLSAADVRQTRAKKDYLSVTFTDGTDSISGNIWDFGGGIPVTKAVYNVEATVGEYNGTPQLNNIVMLYAENQSMTEFNCSFIDDPENVWDMCMAFIDVIQDVFLRKICLTIYEDLKDDICNATSAKGVHHVGIGGNIVHTWEVAGLSRSIAKNLRMSRSLPINEDLVTAGALLHDIGKPYTYAIDGPVITMTDTGLMRDHIIIGLQIVHDTCRHLRKDTPAAEDRAHIDELELLLTHIIGSHHGSYEFGSPVTPKCMEAYIVNYADMISATIETLRAANEKAENEGKDRTDRIFTLGNVEHILQSTVGKWMTYPK